jgi:hypothetical protein
MRWIAGSCEGYLGKTVMKEETSCLERNGVENLMEENNEQLGGGYVKQFFRLSLSPLSHSSVAVKPHFFSPSNIQNSNPMQVSDI